uniref:MTOR-associated protein MEAK7-like n=1 Tax=Myxine glutinosa TaxID=7769 RepID=UPI00358F63A9
MGNSGSSDQMGLTQRLSRFSPTEQARLWEVYDALVKMKPKTRIQDGFGLHELQEYTNATLSQPMVNRLFRGFTVAIDDPKETGGREVKVVRNAESTGISKKQFVAFLDAVLWGNMEDRGRVVCSMANSDGDGAICHQDQMQQFMVELIETGMSTLRRRLLLCGWQEEYMAVGGVGRLATSLTDGLASRIRLGKQLLHDSDKATTNDKQDFGREQIGEWLFRSPLVIDILILVVTSALQLTSLDPTVRAVTVDKECACCVKLPYCEGIDWNDLDNRNDDSGMARRRTFLLDLPSVLFLNSQLPSELRNRWRLLFSSALHGQSFSGLCSKIVDEGPSLLLLRDTDGYVFGGFASCSWELKPQFQGNNLCFLFSLDPVLSIYTCTGYNDHYMYFTHGQQTIPNGLGMGGQHGYFGLWLDSDFGKGHSRAKPSCTTYGSPQLSAHEDFNLECLEVWALGEPAVNKKSLDGRSVLDADPESQAILEMVGKSRHSTGLREPHEEE